MRIARRFATCLATAGLLGAAFAASPAGARTPPTGRPGLPIAPSRPTVLTRPSTTGTAPATGAPATGGDATADPSPGTTSTGPLRGVRIQAAKQRADEAIARRVQKLGVLTARVNGSRTITADHRSTLAGQLSTARDGLSALKATIDAEADVTKLRSEIQSIVDGSRIYVLVEPKVGAVLAADEELAAATKLDGVAAKIQAKIASVAGKDTSAARTALVAMQAATASARQHASGVAGGVIGLAPSGYPANRAGLQAAHAALRQGRDDLRTARRQGKLAVDALRAVAG